MQKKQYYLIATPQTGLPYYGNDISQGSIRTSHALVGQSLPDPKDPTRNVFVFYNTVLGGSSMYIRDDTIRLKDQYTGNPNLDLVKALKQHAEDNKLIGNYADIYSINVDYPNNVDGWFKKSEYSSFKGGNYYDRQPYQAVPSFIGGLFTGQVFDINANYFYNKGSQFPYYKRTDPYIRQDPHYIEKVKNYYFGDRTPSPITKNDKIGAVSLPVTGFANNCYTSSCKMLQAGLRPGRPFFINPSTFPINGIRQAASDPRNKNLLKHIGYFNLKKTADKNKLVYDKRDPNQSVSNLLTKEVPEFINARIVTPVKNWFQNLF